MKISIYGAGYVGLANGLMLAKKNEVNIIDINETRIISLKNRTLNLEEEYSKEELKKTKAIFETKNSQIDTELFILALPTNYDEKKKKFNTSILDKKINEIRSTYKTTPIIIKSTVPVGYTNSFDDENLIFSPEFLREGSSLEDCIKPSRIIIGSTKETHRNIGKLFSDAALVDVEVLFMESSEAEAVKLFSNTYLAMRVAFVNELSNFSSSQNMSTNNILKGVSLDPRIGSHYFRPSTGYGGYCLPKDSKQLLSEFNAHQVENKLFDSIVESNELRLETLVRTAKKRKVSKIYIEGVGHKPGVVNQRESTKIKFAKLANKEDIEIVFIDNEGEVEGFEVLSKPPKGFTNLNDLF